MTGNGNFVYSVDFPGWSSERREFIETRKWCIDNWGQSVEIDIWQAYPEFRNPAWSWERNQGEKKYTCRIFLAGEKEMMWWKLRWS